MVGSISDRLKTFAADHMTEAVLVFAIMCFSLVFAMKPVLGAVLFLIAALLSIFAVWINVGLYSIMLSLNFDNLTRLNLESTLTLTKILVMLVLALIILRTLLSRDRRPLKNFNANPLTLTVYAFFAFSLISLINARDTLLYVGQNLRRVNLVLFYLLLVSLIRDTGILRKVLIVFLVGSVVAGCMGIYEVVTGVNVLELRWGEEAVERAAFGTLTKRVRFKESATAAQAERTEFFRVLGLTGNPDFHAHSMILPSMILLVFVALSKSWLGRILGLSILLLFLVNILASGARGGVIALALGVAVFLILHKMRYKLLIVSATVLAVVVLALIFVTAAPESGYERLSFAAETETITYRMGLSEMALAMIADHPLFGIGTGNFISEYNRYMVPSVPRNPIWTHNCYLQMWAENGIFGLLAYLGLYFFAARNVLRVRRRTNDPFLRAASVALLAVIVSYFFYAGIDPLIESELHWIAFALSTALFNMLPRRTPEGAIP